MRILASFLDRIRLLGLAKGTTAAAEATVTTVDPDHNALDVKAQGTTATSNAILDVATGLPNNATVPTRAVQTGGISSDTEPALVSAGRLAFGWVRRNGALMVGALGRNATAIASATNGVPVYPEDASEWPVVGDAGAAVATAANQDLIVTAINIVQGTPAAAPPVKAAYVAGLDGAGTLRPLLVSSAGNVQTAPAIGTSYSSASAEASKAFAVPKYPVKGRMLNGNAAVRYFQWFNATSLPANGAIPASEQVCATNGTGEIVYPIPTDRYSTGLVGATSTTAPTLTIGSADALFWFDFYPAST